MSNRHVKTALISVYHKEGLIELAEVLKANGARIISTGGTQKYLESHGFVVSSVESYTGYPSILDGRVKTLHPAVFAGILARREEQHLAQLDEYQLPQIDLVVVDLYPFTETLKSTDDHQAIIEKIDIGGISLIRAAAKNYEDVAVIANRSLYSKVVKMLQEGNGSTTLDQRRELAGAAFAESMSYDMAIHRYISGKAAPVLDGQISRSLRYGENPHQEAVFYGKMEGLEILGGKAPSYNNFLDIDAAVRLMYEFKNNDPCFAILKHTNSCGLAIRSSISEAWDAALAGDPVSAFGGILISNTEIDLETAEKIKKIFFEVLIAPSFSDEAFNVLSKGGKKILIRLSEYHLEKDLIRSSLDGALVQSPDLHYENPKDWSWACQSGDDKSHTQDLEFAWKAVKHLKSNAICLVKDLQLIGIGCGQTSRVDALNQAIDKAKRMGFDPAGAVVASDAFFPFKDCVEIGHKNGVKCFIQPGGSIRDQESIDYCNEHGLGMVLTGIRHFKH